MPRSCGNWIVLVPESGTIKRKRGGSLLLHRVSSRLLGPVDPSLRALSGRLKFTVRRHKFNNDSLFICSSNELDARQGPSVFFFITLKPRVE